MNNELHEVERETLLRRIQELQYDLKRAQENTINASTSATRYFNELKKYKANVDAALQAVNIGLIAKDGVLTAYVHK